MEKIRWQKYDRRFLPNLEEQSLSGMATHLNSDIPRAQTVLHDIDPPTPIDIIQQPDADINELRDHHENVQLSEARAFYESKPPPFLQPRYNKDPPGTRIRAQLADNGRLPARPLEVDVVSRPWGDQGIYLTIDLEGQRLIVKTFPGGTPGGGYRRWEGISKGFNKIPVAFKISRRPNSVRASHSGRKSSATGGSDELERYKSRSSLFGARRSVAQSAQSAITRAMRYCDSTSEDDNTSPEVDSGSVSSPAVSDEKVTELSPRITRRPSKIVKLHVSGEVASFLRKRQLSEINDVGSDPVQNFENSAQRVTGRSQVSKISYNEMTFLPKRPKPNQSPELSLLKVIKKPPKRAGGFVIGEVPELHFENSDKFATTKPLGCHSSQIETASLAISRYKQEMSTLCFFFPPDEDCVPIKLRSCMTMSALFASAIRAFDLEDQAKKVRALRATFADVPKEYPTESLLVKRGLPDTFQIFLEFVERSRVWDDGGKGTCTVKVEVLMK